MIRDLPTPRILEGLLFHRIKLRPMLFLVLKAVGLSRIGALPPLRRIVNASRRQMERHLDELERQLEQSGGPCITGSQFTLADVSWAVILERLREADWTAELLTPARPAVRGGWLGGALTVLPHRSASSPAPGLPMQAREGGASVLVLTGLVTALNLLLSLIVGLRLLVRARHGWPVPELSLAIYFLASAFLATPPQVLVYGAMADPRLAVPDPLARALLAFAVLAMAIGAAAAYVFTWKTFRPERLFAKVIVVAGCTGLAVGYAIEAVFEGFAPVMFAGPGHWIGWAGRTAAMLGITFESFRYWWMLRRRMRLGLADPVVTNRFLLWGVWAACATLNLVADLASRGYYWLAYGTIQPVPEYLAATVGPTIAISMLLGAVSAVMLFLTFFPIPAYLRWVEARAGAHAR